MELKTWLSHTTIEVLATNPTTGDIRMTRYTTRYADRVETGTRFELLSCGEWYIVTFGGLVDANANQFHGITRNGMNVIAYDNAGNRYSFGANGGKVVEGDLYKIEETSLFGRTNERYEVTETQDIEQGTGIDESSRLSWEHYVLAGAPRAKADTTPRNLVSLADARPLHTHTVHPRYCNTINNWEL